MGTFGSEERELRRVAMGQHGVATRGQLAQLGFSKKRVGAMVRRAELRRVHRDVYLVGQTWTWLTPFMAAVLAGGPRSAVSHRSAVYLDKLIPHPARPGPVHITVPARRRLRDDRLVIHETTSLHHYEVRNVDGIRVTSPMRTLIDFAGDDATDDELERAVAEAFALGRTNRSAMLRTMPQRPGTARIRTLLQDPRGPKRTRSRPERLLRRLLLGAGIDDFETNARIGPWEVDFYFREIGLVVEVDAYVTHSSPWAFERDRAKTTSLEDRGLLVHRVTDVQIDRDPILVVDRIRRRIDDLSAELRLNHRRGG
jgi:very-short-patch-repair endonuclease